MEGQARQGVDAVAEPALRLSDRGTVRRVPESPGHGLATPSVGRLLTAALVVALLYAVLFPGLLLLVTLALAWNTIRWLLVSVLLVPFLSAIGLLQLLSGLPAIALLVGAIAARWPDRLWPRLVAALMLSLVELALTREVGLSHLLARALPLLMGRQTLFLLGTLAPPVASMLAALLVPRRLILRLLGRRPVLVSARRVVQRSDR